MDYHIVPVLSNTSSTAILNTAFVDLGENLWVDFVLTHTAQDTSTITITQCPESSTSSATIEQVPFVYRSSAVAGTDTLGAATTASSAGYSHSTVDGCTIVSVNPADLSGTSRFVRLDLSTNAARAFVSATAILHPRYAQATPLSSS